MLNNQLMQLFGFGPMICLISFWLYKCDLFGYLLLFALTLIRTIKHILSISHVIYKFCVGHGYKQITLFLQRH